MKLRTKIFIRSLSLCIMLIALIMFMHATHVLHFNQRMMHERYIQEITIRAAEVDRLMLRDDRAAITNLLESIINIDECAAYAFVEQEGQAYAHTFANGVPLILIGRSASSKPEERRFKDEKGEEFHEYFIRFGGSDNVLHIGLSIDEMDFEMTPLLTKIAEVGSITIFLAVLLSIYLSRWTTREITNTTIALQESEEKYRRLSENSPAIVFQFMMTPEGVFTFPYVSNSLRRTFGISAEEVMRNSSQLLSLMHPNDREVFREEVLKSAESLEIYHSEIRWISQGVINWVEVQSTPSMLKDGSVLWDGFFVDITERKRTEEELRKSEIFQRTLTETLPDYIFVLDANCIIRKVNRIHPGHREDDVIGKNALEFVPPEYKDIFDESFRNALESGKLQTMETEVDLPDGRYHFLNRMVPVAIGDDKNSIILISTDMTERKRAEGALRESKETAERYLNVAAEIIISLNKEGTITMLNDSGHGILGYENCELIGENWFDTCLPERMREDVRTVFGKLMKEDIEEAKTYENEILTKDGRERIIKWHNTLLYDKAGDLSGILCSGEDITERKRAELAVIESENKLSSHLQNTPVAAIEWNLDFEVESWNLAAEKIFRFKSDEAMGKHAVELMVPDSAREHVDDIWEALIDNKGGYYSINKNRTKDGDIIICEWNNTPLIDRAGKIYGVASLVQDVTDREHAKEALKESELKYRTLFEGSCEGILAVDVESKQLILANPAICKMLGYNKNEITELKVSDIHPQESLDYVIKEFEAQARQEKVLSTNIPCLRKDGSIFYADFSTTSMVLGGKTYNVGFVTDVSEQKKSREDLERFFNLSGCMICIADIGGHFKKVSPAFEEIMGYTTEELLGRPYIDFVHPDEVESTQKVAEVKLRQGAQVLDFTNRYRCKDGSYKWLQWTSKPFVEENIAFAAALDVTEQKMAEEALKDSEHRYHELFSSVMEGIALVDENELIQFANPSFVKIFGEKSIVDMIGKSLLSYFSEDQQDIILNETEKRKIGNNSQYELELTTEDGTKKQIFVSITPRFDINNKYAGAFGSVLDITETKRLKDLESRAQRLETAGQIAGQVAHDFNNLLAPLVAYPEFIRDEIPESHSAIKYLNDIENSARKIADINQQLLTLGRRGHYNQEFLNLNELVKQSIQDLEAVPKTLSIDSALDIKLMNIMGGGAQIYRVLINLLSNARDAMQDKGHIHIKTKNCRVKEPIEGYSLIPVGDYVRLSVADTGSGIPDENLQNIFDPFYTSKSTDKKRGSGLGLSVVDSVVKDHGGFIDLKSSIGEGATFYLYFPIALDARDENEQIPITGGSENILVVDDDEIQRQVTSRLLMKMGYDVSVAKSGNKAIELVRENSYDLILLDMIMPPGIDGVETFKLIKAIKPEQKAIIVSGFSESEQVMKAKYMGAGAFVKKPLTKKTLMTAVRKELDKRSKAASG